MSRRTPRAAPLALAVLLFASAPARADIPETVRLEAPTCAHLPFHPDRLRELLALELGVSGSQLIDGDAVATVRYEADPCEPGASAFVVTVDQPGQPSREARVSLAAVPLGTLPRALALDIAESLRGGTALAPTAIRPQNYGTDAIRPVAERPADASATDPSNPADASNTAISNAAISNAAISNAEASNDVPADPPSRPGAAFFRLLVGATMMNTPDTGGVVTGVTVGLDIPLADLPLSLRIDAGALLGPTGPLTVLVGGGGVSAFIWADALHELVLRFGPRIAFGYGAALDPEASDAVRLSEELQMTLGVVVGADVRLTDGIDLLLSAEVGTTVHGVRYQLPASAQAGLDGAFWGFTAQLGIY